MKLLRKKSSVSIVLLSLILMLALGSTALAKGNGCGRGECGGGFNILLNQAIAAALAESNSQASSSSQLIFNYEEVVQGQPIIPMGLMPRVMAEENKKDMWNRKFRPPLRGYFTLEELKQRRRGEGNHKVKVPNCKKTLFGKVKTPYKASPGVIALEGVPHDEILALGYEHVKTFNSHAGDKAVEDEAVYETLIDGVLYGAHIAVPDSDLKSVAKSGGINIGGNGVHARNDGSITGGGGTGLTSAEWEGKPWCRTALFRYVPKEGEEMPSMEQLKQDVLSRLQAKAEAMRKASTPAVEGAPETEEHASNVSLGGLAETAEEWLNSS